MQLSGSIVAIVTPFKDGGIDIAAYEKLIEFHVANGSSGVVPCGTTGESATLIPSEHGELIRLTVKLVAGRMQVIAGTGSNATSEALRLTRAAAEAGANAALLITPYYNKPTQEGLYQHYKYIAENADIPLVLYNCPGRCGVSLAPETVIRLSAVKGIAAVKDATGNIDWTSEVCGGCGITVLSGDDSMALPQMSVGARGVISVLANIAPKDTAAMIARAGQGDGSGARELHHKYFKLIKALFIESNPIPVKAAMEMMGLIGPEIRLPLTPLSEAGRKKLEAEMKKAGLL